jgi:hypothetical protein
MKLIQTVGLHQTERRASCIKTQLVSGTGNISSLLCELYQQMTTLRGNKAAHVPRPIKVKLWRVRTIHCCSEKAESVCACVCWRACSRWCVYVCVYIYIYIYIYTHTHIYMQYIYILPRIRACARGCAWVCVCVCLCMRCGCV